MRDVPLDTARDPRADQPDQRGLDHVLAIDEVVVVGLVDAFEQPSADLGQDADAHEFVFQIDDLVVLVGLLEREIVIQRDTGKRAPARPATACRSRRSGSARGLR